MRWGSKVQWGKITCYDSLDWPNWDKANLYCLKTKIREHCFESCNFEGWGSGSVASVFTQQALRTLSLDTPSSWKSWAWQQAQCCGLWIGRRGGLWRSLASQSKTCSRLNKRPCLKNKIKKKNGGTIGELSEYAILCSPSGHRHGGMLTCTHTNVQHGHTQFFSPHSFLILTSESKDLWGEEGHPASSDPSGGSKHSCFSLLGCATGEAGQLGL